MHPGKYIDKIEDKYKQYFKIRPNQKHQSPLQKGDHPEIDCTAFLDQEGVEILYQSLIGSIQWAVSIGHFDINTAVMKLSGYGQAPRTGHLTRARRVYRYLCNFRHFKLRF